MKFGGLRFRQAESRVITSACVPLAAMAPVVSLVGATLGLAPAAAQTQWNEVPLMPGTYREYPSEPRRDTVDIPVRPNGGEIEYMLAMKQGDAIVYSWRALEISDPAKLASEFHGHTEQAANEPGTLIFYRKAAGASENGSLIAPFDGIHGWYLKNDTDRPVVVRLNVSGFYELIPGQIPE